MQLYYWPLCLLDLTNNFFSRIISQHFSWSFFRNKKGFFIHFQVTKWPICRNSEVTGCDVSDTNPLLPADDLAITPTDTTIDFGQKVSVKCAEADMITDSFVNLELVSEGHAFSEIYNPER